MRKDMILPNAAVLACAVLLFHRSFLSGHITWISSLVTLSALLPLGYCLAGHMPRFLRWFAALLNAILFFNCVYAFIGTIAMLARAGGLSAGFYLMTGVLWACAIGTAFVKKAGPNQVWALALNAAFCVAGALGLYARSVSGWMPWMTPVLFAAFIAAAGLNVCLLAGLFAFRSGDRAGVGA